LTRERNISAELIKYGDKILWKETAALMEIIGTSERMPEKWHTTIICQRNGTLQ